MISSAWIWYFFLGDFSRRQCYKVWSSTEVGKMIRPSRPDRLELLSGIHQSLFDGRLMSAVSSIADDFVLDVGIALPTERLVQVPTRLRRTYHVIPALHNDDGQVLDLVSIVDELAIPHPAPVDKVVAFDPRECQSPVESSLVDCPLELFGFFFYIEYHFGSSALAM